MRTRLTLIMLSDLVLESLPPGLQRGRNCNVLDHAGADARRNQTAAALRQLAAWAPVVQNLSLAELGLAYEMVSFSWSSDLDVRSREVTCSQLATLCRIEEGEVPASDRKAALTRAICLWESWQAACDESTDPRQQDWRETFARESARLQRELLQLEAMEAAA